MPTEGGLGVDELAIEGDLEAALGRGDQLDALEDRCPSCAQLGRQTDGTVVVASGNAVLDGHTVPGVDHGRDLLLDDAPDGTPRFPVTMTVAFGDD
jgi:hypothetical protein